MAWAGWLQQQEVGMAWGIINGILGLIKGSKGELKKSMY